MLFRSSTVEAAAGISKVVNTTMAEGIRIVSVRRGVDPRGFTLVSFGGAAGVQVTEVARLLDIKRVVVPNVASVLSAWGMLATDLRYEMVHSHIGDAASMSADGMRRALLDMERQGRSRLDGFDGRIEVQRALDMRYGEQIYEITVPITDVDLDEPAFIDEVVTRFHKRHQELYAYNAPGQEVVIVNARTTIVGKLLELRAEPLSTGGGTGSGVGVRKIYLDGWIDVPVYRLADVAQGERVAGPALFESTTTTVLLRAGDSAVVNEHGWLDIHLS